MIPGQILAGSSPLLAIRYQIVVVFMLAGTALGLLLFVRLAADRYLTAAHQLRPAVTMVALRASTIHDGREQAARRGDHNVGAATECVFLGFHGDAAEDGRPADYDDTTLSTLSPEPHPRSTNNVPTGVSVA